MSYNKSLYLWFAIGGLSIIIFMVCLYFFAQAVTDYVGHESASDLGKWYKEFREASR